MTTAWKRLTPWLPGQHAPQDGEAALRALSAVAEVRRLVDQAELRAVQTARQTGRSWTEIATMLAVTRQSAWERWRDLDDLPSTSAGYTTPPVAVRDDPRPAPTTRRRRTVEVPDVRGLTAAEALGVLTATGLDAESATPDIDLLPAPDEERAAVVVRQYPDSGTRVRGASTVRLWLERGDGEAGVREPRRPTPPPLAARAEHDDAVRQAVG